MLESTATDRPNDSLQRFLFEALDIRGVLARLDESWVQVRTAHTYPEAAQQLLGELLTATALLASVVKVRGTLTVQATGDGPLAAVMAECRDRSELRGIARIRDEAALRATEASTPASTRPLGRGVLTITIRPDGGEPYQGIVPLAGSSLAEALEGYFVQSEQIATRVWLSAGTAGTAGMMIQALPAELAIKNHPEREREEDFNRIALLADTVSDAELHELHGERLLTRLFFEEAVALQQPVDLRFSCNCSRDRTREALRAMPRAELEEIIEEEGAIEMTCQFCHTEYRFDGIDVALVHAEPDPVDDRIH